MDSPDYYAEYLKTHREVRFRHWNYYERLALIDGGTIALVATTVLGNSHGQLKHKYTLAVGLGLLIIAMCSLLLHNFADSRWEAVKAAQEYHQAMNDKKGGEVLQKEKVSVRNATLCLEVIGLSSTFLGIVLLGLVLILSIL